MAVGPLLAANLRRGGDARRTSRPASIADVTRPLRGNRRIKGVAT